MKKRYWIIAVIGILVVVLAASAVFGSIDGNKEKDQNLQSISQMIDCQEQWLDQAQKDGQVTSEQAKAWQEHFNYMRDFHSQNGFGPMGSMMGGDNMMGHGMMGGNGGIMGKFNSSGNSNMMGR